MCPKFQVYKDVAGKTRFRLRADNNKIVATGEAYEQYASCLKGIESIERNCLAPIEDLTLENGPKFPNPKYQIYKDANGEFRFRLKAGNGEIIAQGEGYESKEGCLNGIDVVRRSCNAEIEDPYAKKLPLEMPVAEKTVEKPFPSTQVAAPEVTIPEAKLEVTAPEVNPPKTSPHIEAPVIKAANEIPEVKTEGSSPEATTEVHSIAAPASIAEKQIQESGPAETVLELDRTPPISRGEKIAFQGRLYSADTNEGISKAKIRIWERDRSILGDDYLAFGNTDSDGSFNIFWRARSLTWRKKTSNIYAEFRGNEKAKPAKSTIQTVTIE